jgi:ribosomal-protein-alanine N-acetyltransferase
MTQSNVTIRTLGYSDLPHVIAVERRAFTAPWSLAMFVLELSKPSGICLAAVDSDSNKLVGYLILSRYDTVWHLMNVPQA